MAFLGRLWHRITETYFSCWRDRNATPELAAAYLWHQYDSVLRQLPIGCWPGLVLGIVVPLFLWPHLDHVMLLAWSAMTVSSCTIGLLIWRQHRRLPSRQPVTQQQIWAIALNFIAVGAMNSSMVIYLLPVIRPEQQLILTAIIAAFISTGAWQFSALPPAGLAWVLSLCFGIAIGVWIDFWDSLWLLALLAVYYGAVLSGAVLVTSRRFLKSLVADAQADQQSQVVSLLLHDFESGASDWLWECDYLGRLQRVSPRMASIAGVPESELRGEVLFDVLARFTEPGQPQNQQGLEKVTRLLTQGTAFVDEDVPVYIQGQQRWWSLTAKPLRDDNGRITGWRGVGSDVTAVHERDQQLTHMANVDSLTGLANRYQFHARLAGYFENPQAITPCTLFVLDLDNFKTVNDSLGHATGDELLREVAQRLQAEARPGELLARLGGDEFALIAPGALGADEAGARGAALQSALTRGWSIDQYTIEIATSIGVGFAPANASNADDLLKAADLALYDAKSSGKNTLRFYEPRLLQAVQRRLGLLNEMREGLARGEFFLCYQPQVRMADGALAGFEALVRWQHPVRGLVSPVEFIGVAEESGFILTLGAWVMRRACQDAVQWPGDLRLSVNVSAIEFERTDVTQAVLDTTAETGFPRERLEIELTESTLMRDSATALAKMKTLRQSGVHLSLDDFGTGFSSLAYLRNFPLDKLKIDRSFVWALDAKTGQADAAAIVRAITQLAVALKLETTAEGVETVAQQETLGAIGCTYSQGYINARPMDADKTLAYIRDHGARKTPQQQGLK